MKQAWESEANFFEILHFFLQLYVHDLITITIILKITLTENNLKHNKLLFSREKSPHTIHTSGPVGPDGPGAPRCPGDPLK